MRRCDDVTRATTVCEVQVLCVTKREGRHGATMAQHRARRARSPGKRVTPAGGLAGRRSGPPGAQGAGQKMAPGIPNTWANAGGICAGDRCPASSVRCSTRETSGTRSPWARLAASAAHVRARIKPCSYWAAPSMTVRMNASAGESPLPSPLALTTRRPRARPLRVRAEPRKQNARQDARGSARRSAPLGRGTTQPRGCAREWPMPRWWFFARLARGAVRSWMRATPEHFILERACNSPQREPGLFPC
jgi:hypothetical protein